MKRILTLLLALCLLAFALPALAESAGPQPEPLEENTVLSVDLDGDGTEEQVSWAMVPGQYDTYSTLTVVPADGKALTYETKLLYASQVYVTDLDGDGRQEILMSGDVMSDDYYTWCLHFDGEALYEVLFPDGERGRNHGGYNKYGYGEITAVGNGMLVLTGSQDVLGTWFASRTLSLTPYDRFEFNDAGLWMRNLADAGDDDLWDYAALTTIIELPYEGQDGATGILPPGTKLLVYATDKESLARFSTQDGLSGTLAISRNYEQGWGWLVDGVPEDQCFDRVPYAD